MESLALKRGTTLEEVLEGIERTGPGEAIHITGLKGSSSFFLASKIADSIGGRALFIAPEKEGERAARDLEHFSGLPVLYLPPLEAEESAFQRSEVLYRFSNSKDSILVATPRTLSQELPDGSQALKVLRKGTEVERDLLMEDLTGMGYRVVDMVEGRGEVAVRGYIVDLFPPLYDSPVRLEFIGNEVESIRTFDPSTQRSVSELEELRLLSPGKGRGLSPSGLPCHLLFIKDRAFVREEAERFGLPLRDLLRERKVVYLDLLTIHERDGRIFTFDTSGREELRRLIASRKDLSPFEVLSRKIEGWLEEGLSVEIVVRSEGQKERFTEILEGYRIPSDRVSIRVGRLSEGFSFPAFRLSTVTEEEVLGPKRPLLPLPKRGEAFLRSLSEIGEGDLVVHSFHGIGRYIGLTRLKVEEEEGDYLIIEYAGGDRLYLPAHKLSLIQRYKGGEGASPPLDRLGGATWARTKRRVKKAAEKVARELLRLYAERKALKGYAFSGTDRLFEEFSSSFEYEETPDQRRAIEDVLRDMESPRPMDRLVCGDVGYGKTEVALRASFKAVLHGKQVAFLVPTTILAQQHYETFRYRFAPYPVNVEVLSRFRTRKEQKEILERLKRGEVDIIIGTHRLLQRDVAFKDLGLVIIDEEHRFGVRDKERLKEMRRLVDVLTLTATPIPRTLQMCLSGIRDVSIINTPPENRLSVKTYVVKFDKDLIREAILREVERGGQVFFVHNRVKTIYRMAGFLSDLLPGIRIGVAHGQMGDDELERIMWDFYHRRYDLLVTTSIIESGLDIPSVNTILIDRADTFGLAQLYQLRGRVGRSYRQAYAYLLIPGEEALTEEGRKRLRCMEELSDLGSGLALATWDLEIRGAGEILGTAQSGHVEKVGLDMYMKLLEEAVRELKGERIAEEVEPEIRVHLPCYLPRDYVPKERERLSIYMRLASASSLDELKALEEEVRDRYGKMPPQAANLMAMMELKILAKGLGIREVLLGRKELVLSFSDEARRIPPRVLLSFLDTHPGKAVFTPDQRLRVDLAGRGIKGAHEVLRWFEKQGSSLSPGRCG